MGGENCLVQLSNCLGQGGQGRQTKHRRDKKKCNVILCSVNAKLPPRLASFGKECVKAPFPWGRASPSYAAVCCDSLIGSYTGYTCVRSVFEDCVKTLVYAERSGNVTNVTGRVKSKFLLQDLLAECCMQTVFKGTSTTPAVKLLPGLKFIRKMAQIGFYRLCLY